jgi:hypothetical protein
MVSHHSRLGLFLHCLNLILYSFVLNESKRLSVPQDIEDVLMSNLDLRLSAGDELI